LNKSYAIVGNWDFGLSPKGISTYVYHPDNGKLSHIDTIMESVCATQVSLDEERGVVYVVDSRENLEGQAGGGGYVLAFQIDSETGMLHLINRKETLGSVPDFLCLDQRNQFLLVAHHTSHNCVTQIIRGQDGSFQTKVCFDDASLVLFRLNEDGSIGDICDVSVPSADIGLDGVSSHLHFVMHNPNGDFFIVCDKGLDRIYTYHLDAKKGKLKFLQEIQDEPGSFPRYAVFHPKLPLVYVNHERNAILDTYLYDTSSGKLMKLASTSLLFDWLIKKECPAVEAADLAMYPGGQYLYASVRGLDVIAVMELDAYGGLILKQNIDCGGKNPRGLCVSVDGRYLFALNGDSQTIATFVIEKDGRLRRTPFLVHANKSACMKLLMTDDEERRKMECQS
jgi:6-phosphogluconolactonase (cycloisomerase 2 family)